MESRYIPLIPSIILFYAASSPTPFLSFRTRARKCVHLADWWLGVYLCSQSITMAACLQDTRTANMTTAVSFFTRQVSTVSGRANLSIATTDSLSPPTRLEDELDLPAYRDSLRWLLNFTDAAIPFPSAILENFWVSRGEMEAGIFGPLARNFQSILAFPFWLFNANNYGNIALQEKDMISSLPQMFYTEAAIVKPYTKISFDRFMFLLFIVFQSLVLAFVWGVLLWFWITVRHLPVVLSSFPLFDATFKAKVDSVANQPKLLRADGADLVDIMMGCTAKVKTD